MSNSIVDEAYCDMTGTVGLYGSAVVAANLAGSDIGAGVYREYGISSNKLLAKMASDFKPNKSHLVSEEMEKKLAASIRSHYVGHTQRKLKAGNSHKIELRTDLDILRSHFKKYGSLYMRASGRCINVDGYGSIKRATNSTVIAFDVDDAGLRR